MSIYTENHNRRRATVACGPGEGQGSDLLFSLGPIIG